MTSSRGNTKRRAPGDPPRPDQKRVGALYTQQPIDPDPKKVAYAIWVTFALSRIPNQKTINGNERNDIARREWLDKEKQ
jgi:hypothetical protein